jgi:hypothetical protein
MANPPDASRLRWRRDNPRGKRKARLFNLGALVASSAVDLFWRMSKFVASPSRKNTRGVGNIRNGGGLRFAFLEEPPFCFRASC